MGQVMELPFKQVITDLYMIYIIFLQTFEHTFYRQIIKTLNTKISEKIYLLCQIDWLWVCLCKLYVYVIITR